MGQNIIAQVGQAITQLLSSQSSTLQATGLDIFRGLATILIVWFGVKAALSASQGHGGFHFAKFADLILMIAFGFGMLTYYSTPIPGMEYSFSDLITKEALNISNQIESDQTQQTQSALLGKINSATLLQIHAQQDTNQILAASVQQQLVAQKQQIDAQNRALNNAIYFQQNFPTSIQNVNNGVSNSMHSISLSVNGSY